MNLKLELKLDKFKSVEEKFEQEFIHVNSEKPMVKGKEYPIDKIGKIYKDRNDAVAYVIDFLNENLKTSFNQFYPMSKKPKQVKNEHFSETVLIYELDLGTKEIVHFDLGYFDFETNKWNVLGNDSLILYCWAEIPNPTNFMQNKDWAVDYHEGFLN